MKSDKKIGLIRQPAAGLWEVIGQEQGMQNTQKDAAALGVISLHLELQSHLCFQDPSVPIAPPSTTSDMDLGKEEQVSGGIGGQTWGSSGFPVPGHSVRPGAGWDLEQSLLT